MKSLNRILTAALAPALALLPGIGFSQTAGVPQAPAAQAAQSVRQDVGALRQVVEQFLRVQSAGLPGEVKWSVGQIDSRANLAPCAVFDPFLPAGSRLWGKTTVGVRCTAPSAWTVYIPATVQVTAEYLVLAVPVTQGQAIGPNDVTTLKGDLTGLPSGILTDISQAVGRTAVTSLRAGMPLRADLLKSQQVIQQGQTVRVVSGNAAFRVSAEARALNNAAEGQVVQARTPSGQVVSGVAHAAGVVEVSY